MKGEIALNIYQFCLSRPSSLASNSHRILRNFLDLCECLACHSIGAPWRIPRENLCCAYLDSGIDPITCLCWLSDYKLAWGLWGAPCVTFTRLASWACAWKWYLDRCSRAASLTRPHSPNKQEQPKREANQKSTSTMRP